MNIYLHLETSVRELDSKLLLAVLAASKGHEVVLSNLHNILRGLERKLLKLGILHTKSLHQVNLKFFYITKLSTWDVSLQVQTKKMVQLTMGMIDLQKLDIVTRQ